MRGPLWRTLPFLFCLWSLLLGLGLPALAAPEAAKVTLQVEAGFEGRAKAGQWVPLTVSITNEGAELTGSLEFESRTEIGPNRQQATYQYPVVVPAGATKKLSLQMPASMSSTPPLRLMAGGQLLAEVQPTLEITWDLLIGVLGVEPAEVPSLSGLKFGQRTARLVRLTAQSLPSEPLVLQNLDAILLDRAAWAELPAPQQQAIKTWVEHGGTLLAAGGPEVKRLEPLFPWMGLSLAGVERQNLEGIGAADLARFDGTGWRVTQKSGSQVLAAHRAKGAGGIHFLAFDPSLEPFASWPGLPGLVQDLLSQGSDLSSVQNAGGGPMAVKTGMMLIDTLSQMPVKEIPSTRRLLYLLGLYALLIGPVHLLLLRGFRRLGWALVTLPLLSMAGAGSAWAYMQANRGADVNAVSLAVVEGQPGGTSIMVRAMTGFYLPPGASHSADQGGALLTPVPAPSIPLPGQPYKPTDGRSNVTEGRSVKLDPMEAWQIRVVGAEGAVPVDGTVDSNLTVDGYNVTGTVKNNLPYPLKDALVVVGPTFQRLGDIAPGQTVEVSLIMPIIVGMGGGGPNRIGDALGRSLDIGMMGPGGPTPAQQEQMRRQQLSWGLTNSLPWAESMDQPKVMLVGWMDSTGLPISVDGNAVEPSATALYLQRMEYAYTTGQFHLNSEFVETRMIDSSAGMRGPLQWGWGMAKGGISTLEQVVPAELVERVTEMDLRIPLMEKGPAHEGELPLTLKLFRWADSTWVEKPFPTAALTLPAAEGFLSPDGRLRIQIGKTNDAPLILGAPALTVKGKGVSQ